jgi:hypothetical protein
LKEFNKKLDALIDQTVALDPEAKHCFNMLKEQVDICISINYLFIYVFL